jgi:hypothetical protein
MLAAKRQFALAPVPTLQSVCSQPQRMRKLVALVVLLGLLIGAFLLLRGDGTPSLGGGGPQAAKQPLDPPKVMSTSAVPPTVELRTPVDLADQPTACLKVVDNATGKPVPGAAVYRFDQQIEMAAIAYTDDQGLAPLPLKKPEQLIVAVAGYLLRQAPTQPGSTMEKPQVVQLETDRVSDRVTLRFQLPGGKTPSEVLARFVPVLPKQGNELPLPSSLKNANELLQRAWLEQRTIATLRPVPEVHVQIGHFNASHLFHFGAEEVVHFMAPGQVTIEAATRDGYLIRHMFDPATVGMAPLTLTLMPGRMVDGYVTSKVTGGPVEGALVTVSGGEPLQLSTVTDAKGHFVLSPLAEGMCTLEVQHRDHEIGRIGPVDAGASGTRVELTALPKGTLRGRVRGRPSLAPLAGVRASIPVMGSAPEVAITDQDGIFVLRGTANESVRLVIIANGYQPYSELTDAGAAMLDYDLWPDVPSVRLQAKMTGSITGVVKDAKGNRLGATTVKLMADRAVPPMQLPGRRVLLGSSLMLANTVATSADGSYEIESMFDGPATISVVDPNNPGGAPLVSQRVEIRFGETIRDLALTTPAGR